MSMEGPGVTKPESGKFSCMFVHLEEELSWCQLSPYSLNSGVISTGNSTDTKNLVITSR